MHMKPVVANSEVKSWDLRHDAYLAHGSSFGYLVSSYGCRGKFRVARHTLCEVV